MPKSTNRPRAIAISQQEEVIPGVLLWLLGIPIPVVILLYVLHII